jgi:hypothetical protein
VYPLAGEGIVATRLRLPRLCCYFCSSSFKAFYSYASRDADAVDADERAPGGVSSSKNSLTTSSLENRLKINARLGNSLIASLMIVPY